MNPTERLTTALADRYAIESEIGAGGMATVYLAQDLKHDRRVAVKVLKPELAAVVGPERFLAEIRTTANLAHPHILPLFDSGEADGFLFYVMPYVEGESLRERLDRDGQPPVEESVRIAGYVADALDYAHQQGVIHRDIKPGNILFQAGDPVVTDFGIALAVSAAGEGRLTETGLSLGTPYYMSPEQAAGDKDPAAASDVYSLGCVLYEMLTGDPPHTGSSAQAILGKILLGDVTRPTKLRRTIPANVEGALLKALERLPADRFASPSELAAALKDKAFRHGVGAGEKAAGGPWKGVALVLASVLVVVSAVLARRTSDTESPAALWQEVPMVGERFVSRWSGGTALAPDGSSMVYRDSVGSEGISQLLIKERGSVQGRPIPGALTAYGVTYSPDGEWIAYKSLPTLYKQRVSGSEPVPLYEGVTHAGGKISWMDDGTLLFVAAGSFLVRISEDQGTPPDTIRRFSTGPPIWIHGLPGGRAALAVECVSATCSSGSFLTVVDLEDGTSRTLRNGVLRAWYVPTGHLVWVRRDGAVLASSFDLSSQELGATDALLFDGVYRTGTQAGMVMGQDGTVLYLEGETQTPEYDLVWVDRRGVEEPIEAQVDGVLGFPSLSPDGDRLALQQQSSEGPRIWIVDLLRGSAQALTQEEGGYPTWRPDGGALSFWSRRGGSGFNLWMKRADGVGEAEPLLALNGVERDGVWSPDGRWLIFRTTTGTETAGDIFAWEVGSEAEPIPLMTSRFSEVGPAISPGGRFLAYSSNESGTNQVYVRPFPNVDDGKWVVSVEGGQEPAWNRDGTELFYREGPEGDLVAVEVSTSDSFQIGATHRLFPAGDYRPTDAKRQYDVSPDGQRFVMLREILVESTEDPIAVIQILDFFTFLEERVGGGG